MNILLLTVEGVCVCLKMHDMKSFYWIGEHVTFV